jgi:hypothetical protein
LTDVVEAMHASIARVPGSRATTTRTRGVTGFVYRSIRRVTGWVGSGLDLTLAQLLPLLDRIDAIPSGSARDAVLAALNGVLGDYLAASENPLATSMSLRGEGLTLAPGDGGRVLLLIHGLCMHDGQWLRNGHDHGAALARDLGYRPVYLRYNSGLHVAQNGRELALQLERWIGSADAHLSELSILGYSLGGLVARSALHYASLAGHRWPRRLAKLVFLGTPHHGAPLERGGHWIDLALGLSRYSAPLAALGRVRSAGITDLRHGSVVDDGVDTARAQPVALPRGVVCSALAACKSARDDAISGFLGDGLVPVASALGRHADPARTLAIPRARQWVGYGIHHLDLLDNAAVYARLREAFAATPHTRKRRHRSA